MNCIIRLGDRGCCGEKVIVYFICGGGVKGVDLITMCQLFGVGGRKRHILFFSEIKYLCSVLRCVESPDLNSVACSCCDRCWVVYGDFNFSGKGFCYVLIF